MGRGKKLFGFAMPIKEIIRITENENVQVYWQSPKVQASQVLGANEKMLLLVQKNFGESSANVEAKNEYVL